MGALAGNMVGLKVALEGGRVRGLGCLVGDVRVGTKGGGLLGLWGAGEGFGTDGRVVVVRKAPGVRLTAAVRDVFDGPATGFFGVAVIVRAGWC